MIEIRLDEVAILESIENSLGYCVYSHNSPNDINYMQISEQFYAQMMGWA